MATLNAEKTAARVLRATSLRPVLALVLGSGFDSLQQAVLPELEVPYEALPGFPKVNVPGHSGQLIVGHLAGVAVLLLCGRAHYYEGYSLPEVTFPIRLLAECGIRAVVLTNAAGGINPKMRPGDFMCITDHLNLMGSTPLRGERTSGPPSFLDLSQTYDPYLNKVLFKAARQCQVRLHSGIYAAVPGPCYETPAEVRAFARLGADAVGMSTVPEAIMARACDLRVAAISCITNSAAGLSPKGISHAGVLAMGDRVRDQAARWLTLFVKLLAGPLMA